VPDPETARLFISLFGAVVVGVLAYFGAQRGVTRTLEGQRWLATDEAIRRFRMEDVRPLLHAITREINLYVRIAKLRAAQRPDAKEKIEHLIAELQSMDDWHVYAAALRTVVSEDMGSALNQLQAAADEIHALFVPNYASPLSDADLQRVMEAADRLSSARAALRDAAAVYVTMPVPRHKRSLPPRRP